MFFIVFFSLVLLSDISGQQTHENEALLEMCKKQRTRLYNVIKATRDECEFTIDGKIAERNADIDGFLINFIQLSYQL